MLLLYLPHCSPVLRWPGLFLDSPSQIQLDKIVFAPDILTLDLNPEEKVKALVNVGQVPEKNVVEGIVIESFKDDKANNKTVAIVGDGATWYIHDKKTVEGGTVPPPRPTSLSTTDLRETQQPGYSESLTIVALQLSPTPDADKVTDAGKNDDDLKKAAVPKLTGNDDEAAKTTVESTEPTHDDDDLKKAAVPKLTDNGDEAANTTMESTEPTHDDDDLKKPSATKTSGKDDEAAKTTVESTTVTNGDSSTKMSAQKSAQKSTKEAETTEVSKEATAEASAVSSGLVLPKKRDISADPTVNFGSMQNVFLFALKSNQEEKKQKIPTQKPHFTIHLLTPMDQFPEYLGSKVGTLYNVTGLKQKDNGVPISSSDFRKFPVHTYSFCARMMRAYPEGNT